MITFPLVPVEHLPVRCALCDVRESDRPGRWLTLHYSVPGLSPGRFAVLCQTTEFLHVCPECVRAYADPLEEWRKRQERTRR